jgi:PAS domain S-box-containing protein
MKTIRVLHVDDSDDFAALTATALEREDEAFSVVTETRAEDALARLRDGDIDSVVSDYEMPGMNGLELLAEVRVDHPELPFVLFTGKGSEGIAAEAISKGVTDYLQKEGGTDQYTVLANRIRNGVERFRANREAARTHRFLEKVLEHATDMIAVATADEEIAFASGSVERVLGYTPQELEAMGPFALVHDDHRERVRAQFARRLDDPNASTDIRFPAVHKDGRTVHCRARAYNFVDDPDVGGVLLYTREE